VWIRDGRLETFRHVAQRLNIALKDHVNQLPRARRSFLALATEEVMGPPGRNTPTPSPSCAWAKDTPTLFLEMQPVEQADWAGEDLVDRVEWAGFPSRRPFAFLDSGAEPAPIR